MANVRDGVRRGRGCAGCHLQSCRVPRSGTVTATFTSPTRRFARASRLLADRPLRTGRGSEGVDRVRRSLARHREHNSGGPSRHAVRGGDARGLHARRRLPRHAALSQGRPHPLRGRLQRHARDRAMARQARRPPLRAALRRPVRTRSAASSRSAKSEGRGQKAEVGGEVPRVMARGEGEETSAFCLLPSNRLDPSLFTLLMTTLPTMKRVLLLLLLAVAAPIAVAAPPTSLFTLHPSLFISPLLMAARRAEPPKPTPPPPAITVDTHADTPTEFMHKPFDLGVVNTRGHFDYPRMKAGGLDAEFFAAYVPAQYANKGAAAYCLRIMETIHEMVDAYPTWVRFAGSTSDIRNIVDGGHRAILIGIEGGHAIEDSIQILRAFYRFGARYMTLTHTNTNNWADSSGDQPNPNGLPPLA